MLGSLLLSSPAEAEPEGPKELLAPAAPVLAGRAGCLEKTGRPEREQRNGAVRGRETGQENIAREGQRRESQSMKAQ